jgi:hypothetical protein
VPFLELPYSLPDSFFRLFRLGLPSNFGEISAKKSFFHFDPAKVCKMSPKQMG